jgi:ATP-dependent Lon protease
MTITGNLGTVMKGVCNNCLEYIKSKCFLLVLVRSLTKHNIHLHVPEGATLGWS